MPLKSTIPVYSPSLYQISKEGNEEKIEVYPLSVQALSVCRTCVRLGLSFLSVYGVKQLEQQINKLTHHSIKK